MFKKRVTSEEGKKNLKDIIISVSGGVLITINILIITPLILWKYGSEGMGMLALFSTLVGMSGATNMGLGVATLKFVSKYRALGNNARVIDIIQTTYTIYILIGILLSLILIGSADFIATSIFVIPDELLAESTNIFRLASIGVFCCLMNSVFAGALRGCERFDYVISIEVIVKTVTTILSVIIILLDMMLIYVVLVTLAAQVLGVLARMHYLKKCIRGLKYRLNYRFSILKENLNFGVHTCLTTIIITFRTSIPELLLGSFVSLEAVGIWRVAVRVLDQITILLAKGTQYMFPFISRKFEQQKTEEVKKHYYQATTVVLYIVAVSFPVLSSCFSPVAKLWLGNPAASAVTAILQILAIRYALNPLNSVNYAFMMGTSNTKALFYIAILSFSVLAPAGFIGVYFWGISGLAWAELSILITIYYNRVYFEKKLFSQSSYVYQAFVILAVVAPMLLARTISLPDGAGFLHIMGHGLMVGLSSLLFVYLILRLAKLTSRQRRVLTS
jgi:O-antigen/teichoic acid export membrane protein